MPSNEKPRGYYLVLFIMLLPILVILLLPLLSIGIGGLPAALLMIAFVVLPLVSCGTGFKGRGLFQSHYHGEPFKDEVMDISEDDRIV
ncbi:MAG: hypothetical protein ACFFFO_08050 [Candidatus Thorarchaeota archaeon]